MLYALSVGAFSSVASLRPWMVTADPPEKRAQALLSEMTLSEKLHLFAGNNTMKPYVGAVTGNDRLGIPDLTLNDGPQGFRDNDGHPGTSTQMPSGLSVGATWDPTMAELWGKTMGEEFLGKGSNVQLGPGLCIARVPYNGRNFEYISGEDPYLGFVLAQPAISGIQGTGVIANAKHWVNNNQETNRTTQSADVDERTQFEIYYPPFEGAIKAHVGSVMCSYNKIRSTWSCENPETLKRDLKERLGFDGWVMSDWGATHSASILAGLDQEMPGGSHMRGNPDDQGICRSDLCKMVQNGTVSNATIDDSALRVLTPMFRMGLFDRKPTGSISANVTSAAHTAAARKIASASMVLLKNEKATLPLTSSVSKLAVIGAQASNPDTGGGGSGSVAPAHKSAPLDSINSKMASCGKDCVTFDDGKDLESAAAVAAEAEVAIVFVSTKSGEGADRKNLQLMEGWNGGGPPDDDALVTAVANACNATRTRVVVVAVSPGAILTPWRGSVDAIIAAFMPGQEYGNAIVDVLWGVVSPTARLPVTFPAEENQWSFDTTQWPGVKDHSNYTEGLLVGYRYYDALKLQPAFPFGHGLTYGSFAYSDLVASATSVTFTLTNKGVRDATEVPQLYLSFPTSAGEPPLQLKGFQQVPVPKGGAVQVTMLLDERAVSIWDVGSHKWKVVSGTFTVQVGASSRDIRVTSSFDVNAAE